jgi:hypothetical protein
MMPEQAVGDTIPVEEFAAYLVRRWNSLKGAKANFEDLYRKAIAFIQPERVGFNQEEMSQGVTTTNDLHDSTAPHACDLLAGAIHGYLFSTSIQWFGFKFRKAALNEVDVVQEWLQEVARLMAVEMARSGWDLAGEELAQDLVAMGTGAVMIERANRRTKKGTFPGFSYHVLHPMDYWIEEDFEGRPNVIFILWGMTARQCYKRWPDKCSDKIKARMQREPETPINMLQVIEPREDVRRITGYGSRAAKKRPYASFWVDPDAKILLEEGGYYDFPTAVVRYAKASKETMGRGPGVRATPDIRTLNKAKEFGLKAWAKVLDPPLKKRNKGVIGTIKTKPGSINTVRQMDALAPLYDSNAFRFDVSELKQAELKQSIEKEFYVDQLQLPPVKESKTMSATEIEVRYEQMQKILGPAMGRIKIELLKFVVERQFFMMLQANAFPPAPTVIQDELLDIEFVSPFDKAQKSAEQLSVQRFMGDLAGAAEVVPDVLDRVDPDGYVDVISDNHQVPAKMLRSKEEAQASRNERKKQQMAMLVADLQNKMGAGNGQG